jgi:hypothetical protein
MYTYAFLLHPKRPFDLPAGIKSKAQLVSMEDIAALVELDLDFETLQQSDETLMQAVLAHDRVLRELFQQVTVLPLRFGTRFVSHQGLLDHLKAHQAEYLAKLDWLKNKAEYLLKLSPVPPPPEEKTIAPDQKGRDYFLAKKQAYQAQLEWQQQQQSELEQLLQTIAPYYPHWVRGEASNGTERVYVLGDRIQERLLYEYAQRWQMQFCRWQLSVGDPLPPYHFV